MGYFGRIECGASKSYGRQIHESEILFTDRRCFSFGFIGGSPVEFSSRKLYSNIGIGFLIKNDYLVFNTFQISLSYYPEIPGNGYNIFKANSFRTTDFGFNEFEVGKPEILDISIR